MRWELPLFSRPSLFFGPPVPDSSSVLSRLPRRAHINTTARHFVSLRFWSFLFLPSPLSPERSLPGSPVLAFGTPLLCLRQQAIVLKCRSPLRKGIVTFFPKSRPLTTSLSGCLDAPADTPGAGSEKTYQLTMASYQHFSVIEYRNHVSQGWPQVLCRGLGAPSPADEHAGREGGHLRTISHGAFLALRPSTPNRMQLSSLGLSPSQHRRTRVQMQPTPHHSPLTRLRSHHGERAVVRDSSPFSFGDTQQLTEPCPDPVPGHLGRLRR